MSNLIPKQETMEPAAGIFLGSAVTGPALCQSSTDYELEYCPDEGHWIVWYSGPDFEEPESSFPMDQQETWEFLEDCRFELSSDKLSAMNLEQGQEEAE